MRTTNPKPNPNLNPVYFPFGLAQGCFQFSMPITFKDHLNNKKNNFN